MKPNTVRRFVHAFASTASLLVVGILVSMVVVWLDQSFWGRVALIGGIVAALGMLFYSAWEHYE